MAFECSYAGVPLCVPTPEVQEWVDGLIPLLDLRDVEPSHRWSAKNLVGVGSLVPTGSAEPRVGQLFWPTGATRWAVGRFLATGDQVQLIKKAVFGPNLDESYKSKDLILQADADSTNAAAGGRGTRITASLHCLPPRPLAGLTLDTSKTGTDRDLYLLTLVDARYFWQWAAISLDGGTEDTPREWSDAFSAVAGALGVGLSPGSISGDYGKLEPDSSLFTNEENAARILDALLANTGRVLVAKFDGTFEVQEIIDNRNAVKTERARWEPVRTAGGVVLGLQGGVESNNQDIWRKALLPSVVQVTFPQWITGQGYYKPDPQYRGWVLDSYNRVYTASVDLSSTTGYGQYVGTGLTWTKTFHDTAKAEYPGVAEIELEAPPDNASDLTALATQLAKDYVDGLISRMDEVYPGIVPWQPDGFNDILLTYRDKHSLTRVQGLPFNSGVEEMQHGFGPLPNTDTVASPVKIIRVVGGAETDGWDYYPGIIQKDFIVGSSTPWEDEDTDYDIPISEEDTAPINCWLVDWYTYVNVVGYDGNSAYMGIYQNATYDPNGVIGTPLPVYATTQYRALIDVVCNGDPPTIQPRLGG